MDYGTPYTEGLSIIPRSVTLRESKGLLTRCFGRLSMTIGKQARTIIERSCSTLAGVSESVLF